MKHAVLKAAGAGLISVAGVAAMAIPAHADSTIIQVNKTDTRSATHRIVNVGVWVTCSDDTTSASLSATVTQVTAGGTQTASGALISLGAFECTGDEELVFVPVRRPTGGFNWVAGSARVSNVVFVTDDPNPGVNIDIAKGRTVTVK